MTNREPTAHPTRMSQRAQSPFPGTTTAATKLRTKAVHARATASCGLEVLDPLTPWTLQRPWRGVYDRVLPAAEVTGHRSDQREGTDEGQGAQLQVVHGTAFR